MNDCLVVDDVQIHGMALRMMRDLFSSPCNYGPHTSLADKFIFVAPKDPTNTVDVLDWDDRMAETQSRPTVYVRAGDVGLESSGNQNSEGETQADGGGRTYLFYETLDLQIRCVSANAGEARVLSRLVLDRVCGLKDLLHYRTNGQVTAFDPVSKTAPAKLKREENMANLWACDVIIKVRYSLVYRMREAAPVIAEIVSMTQLT